MIPKNILIKIMKKMNYLLYSNSLNQENLNFINKVTDDEKLKIK